MGKFSLQYDEEWLSVLCSTKTQTEDAEDLDVVGKEIGNGDDMAETDSLRWVRENITTKGLLKIPHNFKQ